jgi:hypothetical protein
MLKWLLSMLALSLLIPEVSPEALRVAWATLAYPLFVMAPLLFFGGVTFALFQRTDL